MKKTTVKEVRRWMKTLEENRYRKLVNADCRRIAWFVNNNLAEKYENMPESIRKKWSKAAYGKERYLANEFIKSKKAEQKLRESIRKIIIDEAKESGIDIARRIVKNHQSENGVDVQTANLILKIHQAYDKNPSLQKKFERIPLKKLAQGVWRFVK